MGIVRSIQKGEQPASQFDKDARDAEKDNEEVKCEEIGI